MSCLNPSHSDSFHLFCWYALLNVAIFLSFMIKRWAYVVTWSIFEMNRNLLTVPDDNVCAWSGDLVIIIASWRILGIFYYDWTCLIVFLGWPFESPRLVSESNLLPVILDYSTKVNNPLILSCSSLCLEYVLDSLSCLCKGTRGSILSWSQRCDFSQK